MQNSGMVVSIGLKLILTRLDRTEIELHSFFSAIHYHKSQRNKQIGQLN